jgi:hypothetical protein
MALSGVAAERVPGAEPAPAPHRRAATG